MLLGKFLKYCGPEVKDAIRTVDAPALIRPLAPSMTNGKEPNLKEVKLYKWEFLDYMKAKNNCH